MDAPPTSRSCHVTTRLSPEHVQRPPVRPAVSPPRPAARLCRDIGPLLSTGASHRGNDTGTALSDMNSPLGPRVVRRRHIASSHDHHRRPFHHADTACRTAVLRPPASHHRRLWRALRALVVLGALAVQCHRGRGRRSGSRYRARSRRSPSRGTPRDSSQVVAARSRPSRTGAGGAGRTATACAGLTGSSARGACSSGPVASRTAIPSRSTSPRADHASP